MEAASEVWRQLPARSEFVGGMDVMAQLEVNARSLHRSISGSSLNQVDPTLQEIGQLLTRAAEIIERSDLNIERVRNWNWPQLQDAFAARVSLVHTVYVSAHAVSVSLAATAWDESWDRRIRVHAVPTDQLRQNVAAVEELASSYLDGHYPGAYDRRHRPPVDNDRLGAAVSAWGVQTQRFLSREPRTAGLVTVAGALRESAVAARHLWAAAAETGHVDARRFQYELSPALESMTERWGEAQTMWQTLRHPLERVDPNMYEATRELKAAMNELAREGSAMAATGVIARRVNLTGAVRALHRLQASSAGVSQSFEEAVETGQLSVNPRTANKLVKESFVPGHEGAVISPRAVALGRAVPIPEALRARAGVVVGRAANASRSAMRASMSIGDERDRPAAVLRPQKETGRPARPSRDREHSPISTEAVEGPRR
ncbi:hypothetical protein MWU75_07180 [Ornithinimicrobium sp. F0845]|uniref:hypothetical protein n=1 Tax=Ornithinimicrobium sp. F0845 TaxID=2926412 RepID=UPI001FF64212|nr:hypothetical protein [Ornithinimicrobium sp. F0845]MCK0111917.1 hypothetical protein [Ornithinimicrobium sp. F0845]